jgi:hypothetical protein
VLYNYYSPTLYSNTISATLEYQEHVEAVQECSRALTVDPENFKALLRRGQARVQLGQLRLALADMVHLDTRTTHKHRHTHTHTYTQTHLFIHTHTHTHAQLHLALADMVLEYGYI